MTPTLPQLCDAVPQEVVDAMRKCVGDVEPLVLAFVSESPNFTGQNIEKAFNDEPDEEERKVMRLALAYLLLTIESERTR